jgi:GNAT superfamily N-acetyltransferase
VQVLCHLGYEPKDKDVHDVLLLHRTFAVSLPPAYQGRETLRLRPALAEDVEIAFALLRAAMRRYVESTWGSWDDAEQHRLFAGSFTLATHRIIEESGRAIGCLAVEERPDHVFLARIFLLPEAQGRGIGTRLVCEIRDDAHRRGLPVALTILKVNPARRLYERLGFRVVDETTTHFRMEARPG